MIRAYQRELTTKEKLLWWSLHGWGYYITFSSGWIGIIAGQYHAKVTAHMSYHLKNHKT